MRSVINKVKTKIIDVSPPKDWTLIQAPGNAVQAMYSDVNTNIAWLSMTSEVPENTAIKPTDTTKLIRIRMTVVGVLDEYVVNSELNVVVNDQTHKIPLQYRVRSTGTKTTVGLTGTLPFEVKHDLLTMTVNGLQPSLYEEGQPARLYVEENIPPNHVGMFSTDVYVMVTIIETPSESYEDNKIAIPFNRPECDTGPLPDLDIELDIDIDIPCIPIVEPPDIEVDPPIVAPDLLPVIPIADSVQDITPPDNPDDPCNPLTVFTWEYVRNCEVPVRMVTQPIGQCSLWVHFLFSYCDDPCCPFVWCGGSWTTSSTTTQEPCPVADCVWRATLADSPGNELVPGKGFQWQLYQHCGAKQCVCPKPLPPFDIPTFEGQLAYRKCVLPPNTSGWKYVGEERPGDIPLWIHFQGSYERPPKEDPCATAVPPPTSGDYPGELRYVCPCDTTTTAPPTTTTTASPCDDGCVFQQSSSLRAKLIANECPPQCPHCPEEVNSMLPLLAIFRQDCSAGTTTTTSTTTARPCKDALCLWYFNLDGEWQLMLDGCKDEPQQCLCIKPAIAGEPDKCYLTKCGQIAVGPLDQTSCSF
jgi:hypothetical protein